MKKNLLIRTLPYVLLNFYCASLFSNEKNSSSDASLKEAEWEIGIGLLNVNAPHYAGSDQEDLFVFPFPFISYESEQFSLSREGLKQHISHQSRWDIDISFAATFPVDSDENRARRNMPDLDWVVLGGPSLDYYFIRSKHHNLRSVFPFKFAVTSDFTYIDYTGWEFSPGFRWDKTIKTNKAIWELTATTNLFYSSQDYNQLYYGVDSAFATSERSAFQANRGLAGAQLTLGVTRYQNNIWFGAFIRTRTLSNAVFKDSPLVKTTQNYYYGFAFSWIFSSSK